MSRRSNRWTSPPPLCLCYVSLEYLLSPPFLVGCSGATDGRHHFFVVMWLLSEAVTTNEKSLKFPSKVHHFRPSTIHSSQDEAKLFFYDAATFCALPSDQKMDCFLIHESLNERFLEFDAAQ